MTAAERPAVVEAAVRLAGRREAEEPGLAAFLAALWADALPEGATAEGLLAAARSLWAFGARRAPGEALVRAFNAPEGAPGGRRTTLEIVQDDMPFLVDSVRAEINRLGVGLHLVAHPVLPVARDGAGARQEGEGPRESFMHVQVEALGDAELLDRLAAAIADVLAEVRAAVEDWPKMRARLRELADGLAAGAPEEERDEARAFLEWADDNRFTFLGYRGFTLTDGATVRVEAEPGSGLGVLREDRIAAAGELVGFDSLAPETFPALAEPELLRIGKSARRARVHRPSRMDAFMLSRLDASGRVVGLDRFVGLFTSTVHHSSPREAPIVGRKIRAVIARAGYPPGSHNEKALLHILETYPRDELFAIETDALAATARGILGLQDRQRVALFVRRHRFMPFATCLVFCPRERYSTELRERFVAILEDGLGGAMDSFAIQIGDDPMARLQLRLALAADAPGEVALAEIERRLAQAVSSWGDRLQAALIARHGEERGLELARRYARAFPTAWRERFGPEEAPDDIERLERAAVEGGLAIALYRPEGSDALRLKLCRRDRPIPLSDVLPSLENMGLRVIGEEPFEVRPAHGGAVWVHDFSMRRASGRETDPEAVRQPFEESFERLWRGDIEDDGLNALVLEAGLDWRRIQVLRAFSRFLRQAGAPFSLAYMERTLARYGAIARRILAAFEARFDPARADAGLAERLRRRVEEEDLPAVESLDEDRILRAFLNLVFAAVRTSHYRMDADGEPRPWLSFKFRSADIPELPEPRPLFEIFVYSPRMEGAHLRGGKVARGGIRWSDRPEDFRTEILGLMKAQMVKNAVIVPVGSKGGFVLKRPPPAGDREALQAEGVACYRILLRGMLDLTDNLEGGAVRPPEGVLRHDDDDPYLVVAADKGTATFSDHANRVAADYGFWLGDAFASGGRHGYDHKGMGITARGGWESVKRHFRELGRDIASEPFTCAGVGDMSGDVFGNAMLLAPGMKLVAAFNHLHIFIDPDPDPEAALAERRRLFELPRSSWADYDPALLSRGGGVFARAGRRIELAPEAAALLGLPEGAATPNETVRAILRAPVDLLWLGGIGAYVKAEDESHLEVGDRANDAVRIDAGEVRARAVGEGANLGWTQRARIAYARAGGRINTDFIDNSGGVDTSDREVNIKVLLAAAGVRGEARNRLLESLTDEVARQVLRNNYLQSQAISIEEADAPARLGAHLALMRGLERAGRLDRALEFLPDDEAAAEREAEGRGLTRPEIAVLLSYAKTALYEELLASDLPDDPRLEEDLLLYFPKALREPCREAAARHGLRREILATLIVNRIVNRAGVCFVESLKERSGREASDVARAFTVARAVFGLPKLWDEIEALDGQVAAETQTAMLGDVLRLLERTGLWLLRHVQALDLAPNLAAFAGPVEQLAACLERVTPETEARLLAERAEALAGAGAPEALARRVAALDLLAAGLDIARLAEGGDAEAAAAAYFAIGERFGFGWLARRASAFPAETAWQRLAVETLLDELQDSHARLAAAALFEPGWEGRCAPAVARFRRMLDELRQQETLDPAMMAVVASRLRALAPPG